MLVGSGDPRVYRLTAIQKAAYRIAASATVAIGSPSETAVPLTFQFPKGSISYSGVGPFVHAEKALK